MKKVDNYSLQIVPIMSCRVTPFGFFTIEHHGLARVMTYNSVTRGRVATSSLASNGRSRSVDSAL